jgi:signal transduction histidine kinase
VEVSLMRPLLEVASSTWGEPLGHDAPARAPSPDAEAMMALVGDREALLWLEAGRVTRASDAARRLYGLPNDALDLALDELELGRGLAEELLFEPGAFERGLRGSPEGAERAGAAAAPEDDAGSRSGTFSVPEDYTAQHRRADGAVVEVEVHVKRLPGGRSLMHVRPRDEQASTLRQTHRLATIGAVAAGALHEINNPMTCVQANLDFAAQTLDELESLAEPGTAELVADLSSALADAREGAAQALRIARELKTLARAEASRVELVDPCAAIASAARLVNVRVREQAKLITQLDAQDARVRADPGRLSQILLNLILNAAQAFPEERRAGNEIVVSCSRAGLDGREGRDGRDGEVVRIEVRDNGVGIEPALARRLFTPFVSGRRGGGGLGLGLSLCRELALQMGGTLTFESAPGEGTTFRLTLPRADEGLASRQGGAESGGGAR